MVAINKIKNSVISLALLALATGFTYADSGDYNHNFRKVSPEQRVDRQIEGMKKRLNITNEQATQIAGILKQEHQTLMADHQKLMDAPPESKGAARIQLQQDRLNLKEKVLSNLTVDQRITVEEMHKHRMQHMRRMHRREERHEHRFWNRHHR